MGIPFTAGRKAGAFRLLLLTAFFFLIAPTVARANMWFETDEMPDGTRQIDVERIVESKADNGSVVPVVIDGDGTGSTVGNQVANLPKVGKSIKAQYKNGKIVSWREVTKTELKARSDALDRFIDAQQALIVAIIIVLVIILTVGGVLFFVANKVLDHFY